MFILESVSFSESQVSQVNHRVLTRVSRQSQSVEIVSISALEPMSILESRVSHVSPSVFG